MLWHKLWQVHFYFIVPTENKLATCPGQCEKCTYSLEKKINGLCQKAKGPALPLLFHSDGWVSSHNCSTRNKSRIPVWQLVTIWCHESKHLWSMPRILQILYTENKFSRQLKYFTSVKLPKKNPNPNHQYFRLVEYFKDYKWWKKPYMIECITCR